MSNLVFNQGDLTSNKRQESKRYYDYDYDNNVILMFDADEPLNLVLNFKAINGNDKKLNPQTDQEVEVMDEQRSEEQEAEVISNQHSSPSPNKMNNKKDDSSPSNSSPNTTPSKTDNLNNSNNSSLSNSSSSSSLISSGSSSSSSSNKSSGRISWISSTSPKGKKTAYQLDIAHSYTLNESNTMISARQINTNHHHKQSSPAQQHQIPQPHSIYTNNNKHPHNGYNTLSSHSKHGGGNGGYQHRPHPSQHGANPNGGHPSHPQQHGGHYRQPSQHQPQHNQNPAYLSPQHHPQHNQHPRTHSHQVPASYRGQRRGYPPNSMEIRNGQYPPQPRYEYPPSAHSPPQHGSYYPNGNNYHQRQHAPQQQQSTQPQPQPQQQQQQQPTSNAVY